MITIPHPVNANHNGGQLQFLGNLLYFGDRRRRLRRRPAEQRPEQGRAAGQAAADRPARRRRQALLGPGRQPLRRQARPRRDLQLRAAQPLPLLLRHGHHGQPRIAIGDVGQNQFEELDYTTVGRADGANFGWDAFEGFAKYTDENSGTPDPGGTVKPIFAYPHSRGGSCSIIGGYVVRDRRLAGLRGRYVYADLCEGQLRSLVPHLKRASGDRKLGLQVAEPQLLRRRPAAPALRDLARRSRLPARPPLTRGRFYFLRASCCIFLSTLAFMAVMAPRESWTDERLDDLAKQMDTRFNVLGRDTWTPGSIAEVVSRPRTNPDLVRCRRHIALTVITAMLIGVISLIATQLLIRR